MKIIEVIQGKAESLAYIKGSEEFNTIYGTVYFYPWSKGSIIKLEIMGLPKNNKNNFFGFHIHSVGDCLNGDNDNTFPNTEGHFDIDDLMHPNHTGDLPMIYSNNGYSYMMYYTARFTPTEVIGKSIIIHENKDDLETNPSGNSGKKIACGIISKVQ